MSTWQSNDSVRNLIIIGSGPAGYTAAIYAARANLEPLVFEGSVTASAERLAHQTEASSWPLLHPQSAVHPSVENPMCWGRQNQANDRSSSSTRVPSPPRHCQRRSIQVSSCRSSHADPADPRFRGS